MENAVLQEILEKPFEQFMQERSSDVRDRAFHGPSHVFVDCPEDDYDAVFGALNTQGGIHVAVSGSVEPALAQITEAKPDLSLLLDINPSAIRYLRLMMAFLEDAESPKEYWRRFDSIFESHEELDEQGLFARARCNIPDYLVKEALALANSNIRPTEDSIRLERLRVSTISAKAIEEQHQLAQRPIKNRKWSYEDRFYRAKRAWNEGRIKGIVQDFTSGGLEVALDVAEKTGLPITTLYVSNVPAYNNGTQLRSMLRLIKKGVDTGAIRPDCKMIDWSSWSTRIGTAKEYVDARMRYLH
jgi:hypothetical protein